MARVIMLASGDEVVLDESSSGISDEFTSSADASLEADTYAAIPRGYTGGKYYTPTYGNENFYTPWGNESLDTGFSYAQKILGSVSLVAVFIFALPFVIRALSVLIRDFKNGMTGR